MGIRSKTRLRGSKEKPLEQKVLATPAEKELLFLYLAATNQVVSTVLVVERHEEVKIHGV